MSQGAFVGMMIGILGGIVGLVIVVAVIIGVIVAVGSALGSTVGIGIGVFDKISKSFASLTRNNFSDLLYSPTAIIRLPTNINKSILPGTSNVIASEEVVKRKYF